MTWQKIWTVIDIASSIHQVFKDLKNFATNTADKEIEQEFKKHIAEYIQQLLIKLKKEINQKTIIYICWSIMGILLLTLSFSKPVYYSSLSLMTIIFLYTMVTSFRSLKNLISLINNFESHVKQTLQTKIQSATQESWKAKIGLWLSSRNFKDFENLVITSVVRELLRLVKNNKVILSIRVFAYIVALLLFRETLIHIIKYAVTLF